MGVTYVDVSGNANQLKLLAPSVTALSISDVICEKYAKINV